MHQIVGIGEVLWDIFPDGPRFGGAPANYACSIGALGKTSALVRMVSAVGDDDLGRQAIERMTAMGVNVSAIEVNQRPTGQVNVCLDDAGVASYVFAENSAWDDLKWGDNLAKVATDCDAVCFGTLGQRSDRSRETIQRFVKATPESALRVFDVNLRPPFVNEDVIRQSLSLANVLKLNDDELPVLAAMCGAEGTEIEILGQLAEHFHLRLVALTRGARGAAICCDGQISDRPGKAVAVVDTVGAGDAFTAAMTLGLLRGQDIDTVNQHAIATASYVCCKPGATVSFPDHLLPA